MKNVFYVALMSAFILSCNNSLETVKKEPVVNLAKEKAALMAANRSWAKAASPEEFFSFIDENALMMPPDGPVVKGHERIGKMLAEFQSLPGFAIKWEPQEGFVSASGDLGYTVDRILVNFDGEDGSTVNLFEKGVTVWKKNATGEWKMVIDIWNVDKTIASIYK